MLALLLLWLCLARGAHLRPRRLPFAKPNHRRAIITGRDRAVHAPPAVPALAEALAIADAAVVASAGALLFE